MAAAAGFALPAVASASGGDVESLLRARRPDVDRWQVEPLADGPPPSAGVTQLGRLAARTAVRYSDGHVRWFSIEGFRDVLVSAHRIEGGAALQAEDARLEPRDVIALPCEPLRELPVSKAWRARRALAAGEVLCSSTIEPSPDVERNSRVTLTASRGAIQVSRVLTATSDAHTGERVRLKDADGVSLTAIVTGPGAARVAGEMK